ncbi:MAG: tetratricopeptide repeat protein [Pirellulaceae bacterium]
MSESHQPVSEDQSLLMPEEATRLPKSIWRRYLFLAGIFLTLAVAVGIFFFLRQDGPPELPEIPTVNLDGADPEISKSVRVAHDVLTQAPLSAIAWGQYAMVLHAHGFSDAAHVCYSAAASLEPKNPDWPYLQGDLHRQGPGGPAAALPHFRLAAGRGPPHSMAQLRLADTLLELGRLDDAEVEYGKSLAARPSDELSQLGLAKLALARQQYGDSLKYLNAIAGSPGTRNQACVMRARVYDRLGNGLAAERERQMLAELPDDALRVDDPMVQVARLGIGVAVELAKARQHMDQNQFREMLAILENAVHRYPDSFEAWDALGSARGMANDPVAAERAVRRSIQLSPKNAKGWLNLGDVLIWQQRFPEAEEAIQKVLALDPKRGPAYYALGQCREGQGDLPGAVKAYREALRYFPNHQQARERLEILEKGR